MDTLLTERSGEAKKVDMYCHCFFLLTTALQSMIYAKLAGNQRFDSCQENGLANVLPVIPEYSIFYRALRI